MNPKSEILSTQQKRDSNVEGEIMSPEQKSEFIEKTQKQVQNGLDLLIGATSNPSQQTPSQTKENQKQPSSKNRLKEFEKVKEIGRGSYGTVYKVKNKNGVFYAMKEVSTSKLKKDKKIHQIYMEKVIRHFKFPGIPEFHSCFGHDHQIYFVMAFAEGGQLSSLINKFFSLLNEDIIRFYVAEMVLILEYLHSQGFSHRDFKPENLVITSAGHLQLIDFGTLNDFCQNLIPNSALQDVLQKDETRRSRITDEKKRELRKQRQEQLLKLNINSRDSNNLEQDQNNTSIIEVELQPEDLEDIEVRVRSSTFCGTPEYLCPEMLEDDICEMNGDLWALGCTIYKMFTKTTPFYDPQEFLIFNKIKQGNFNRNHEMVPSTARDLICKLLVVEEKDRLGSLIPDNLTIVDDIKIAYWQIKKHPFFKDIKFDLLYSQPPPKCVIDMLDQARNPWIRRYNTEDEKKKNSDFQDGSDSEEEDQIIKQMSLPLQKTSQNSGIDQKRNKNQLISNLIEKSGNDSDEEGDLRTTIIPISEIFKRIPSPYTEDKVVFTTQIIKVNKKLLIFKTKRPRQILLFDTDPITIIYYMPFRKVPRINLITLDEKTIYVLENQSRISFQIEKQKFIFDQPKSNAPTLLYQAIQKLISSRLKQK